MAKRAAHLAALLLPVILLFGLAELGARLYEWRHPTAPVDFAGGFDDQSRAFLPEGPGSGWMVRNPRKAMVFQPQRFLRQKPRTVLRIAFLGESSVNLLQGELMDWTANLRRQPGNRFSSAEILNFGAKSYGSQRLAVVAREILQYQPDLLLIYMGHNEFEEMEQLHLILPGRAAFLEWAFHSAAARLALDFWVEFQVRRIAKTFLADRPNTQAAWLETFSPEEVRERMAFFRKNLEYIVGLFSSRGIPVILGTIPSNLIHPQMKGVNLSEYEDSLAQLISQKKFAEARAYAGQKLAEAPGRHQSSPLENGIIREVAHEFGVRLAGVEDAVIAAEPNHVPGASLFFDHCHLNEKGNHILRQEFEKEAQSFISSWIP